MKPANNNEVDLLLQSLARGRDQSRQQSGSPWAEDSGAFSEHLDADELNSYAEGAVPAPARTRYLEHLADCEACRGIVVGLTQAAGAAGRYEVEQPERGSNFWQKLAALFSPLVLRLAVPALVLTAVIGIGLLALWRQRQPEFLAQNHAADSAPAATKPGDAGVLNPAPGATPSSPPSGASSGIKAESDRESRGFQDEKPQEAQRPSSATESTVEKPLVLKDSLQPREGADVTTRTYASEPKAAAPPPPVMSEEAEKSGALAKERPAKRADQELDRDEVTRNRGEVRNQPNDDEGHGPYRSNRNNAPASPAANQRNEGFGLGRGGPSADKKKVSSVETRSVSGRHFARSDDVWVDTDYDGTRSTIKVKRGSDQYRALVADEPGIRAIAEQLSGTVIVVWKNRAYRIQ